MKKLHKLLLKSFVGPLVATFFIALFILILQFLWQKIDDLAGKGLEGEVIAELLTYASAGLVPTALPLAVLVSSIMTFGNLGENFELTAVKSSGISLQKFMRPLIVLTIAFTIGIFFYSNHVIPYTNLKAMSLIYDIKKQREELQIREGVFYNAIEGYSIKVGKKNPKTKLLKDVMIYDHSSDNKGNAQVTIADSGYIRMNSDETKLMVTLFKGQTYQEMEETRNKGRRREPEYPHQITKFDKQTLLIDLKGFSFTRTDEDIFSDHYQMLNLSQLEANRDSIEMAFINTANTFSKELDRNYYIKNSLVDRLQKSRQKKKNNTQPIVENEDLPNKEHAKIAQVKNDTTVPKTVEDTLNKTPDTTASAGDSIASDSTFYPEHNADDQNLYTFDVKEAYDTLTPFEKTEALRHALNYARRNSKKISNSKQRFEHKKKIIYKHQIEWHKKFTLSFACIIFFFIGAPLGSIIRKGGLGAPLVISVLLFIVYYIVSMTGENFAEKGVIPAFAGMWFSSFLFLPIGIFLTYKATNDSVILNTETYMKAIKKIFSLRSKNKQTNKGKQEVDR